MRFDSALPAAIEVLSRTANDLRAEDCTVVRDAHGTLTLVIPDDVLTNESCNELADSLHGALGVYSPGVERVLLRQSDLIDPHDVLDSPDRVFVPELNVYLVDRLLTNQDWTRQPRRTHPPLPTATFFSIKGGVGRTTAIAVLAWQLARAGKRVLVIDLDLEAPGIGTVLLNERPDFGLIDWLVESLVSMPDADFFEQMLAVSPLAEGTNGDIRVVPAYGAKSKNYVAKLGRAYMPTADSEGRTRGIADRILALLDVAAGRLERPDVVLLDARAGLHDLGSAAVTQLGAEVFLFSRSDSQSRDGYQQLFEHLRTAKSVRFGMPDDDLRWRLMMVSAQIEITVGAEELAVAHAYEAWTDFYDDEEKGEGASVFGKDDEQAPHFPVSIAFDPRVRGFEFLEPMRRPSTEIVDAIFGRFVRSAMVRLDISDGGEVA